MEKQKLVDRTDAIAFSETAQGTRVTYYYSSINMEGDLIANNQRGNFICMDEELQAHLDAIKNYIETKKLNKYDK